MVGSATAHRRFRGPPAPRIASFRSETRRLEILFAFGCTLKTTELPAAIIPMELHVMVAIGFVTGVMAPITPYGARSVIVSPCSSEKAEGCTSSTPGRLLRGERVLHLLVAKVAEARLRHGLPGKGLVVGENCLPHRLDHARACVQGKRAQLTLRADAALHGAVHVGKDRPLRRGRICAAAEARSPARPRRAAPRYPCSSAPARRSAVSPPPPAPSLFLFPLRE